MGHDLLEVPMNHGTGEIGRFWRFFGPTKISTIFGVFFMRSLKFDERSVFYLRFQRFFFGCFLYFQECMRVSGPQLMRLQSEWALNIGGQKA